MLVVASALSDTLALWAMSCDLLLHDVRWVGPRVMLAFVSWGAAYRDFITARRCPLPSGLRDDQLLLLRHLIPLCKMQ